MGRNKDNKKKETGKGLGAITAVTEMYGRNAKWVNWAIVGLLFVLAFYVRVNAIAGKTELHSDEVFSMALCTCDPNYNVAVADGTYTGAQLKDMIAHSGDTGFKGMLSDLRQLWVNNGDAPHASLYYMALRVALTGYDAYDLDGYIVRGGVLNMLFLYCRLCLCTNCCDAYSVSVTCWCLSDLRLHISIFCRCATRCLSASTRWLRLRLSCLRMWPLALSSVFVRAR